MPIAPPPPLDDEGAALEARVRAKLARGERLAPDEGAFLASLPGAREASADFVRKPAKRR